MVNHNASNSGGGARGEDWEVERIQRRFIALVEVEREDDDEGGWVFFDAIPVDGPGSFREQVAWMGIGVSFQHAGALDALKGSRETLQLRGELGDFGALGNASEARSSWRVIDVSLPPLPSSGTAEVVLFGPQEDQLSFKVGVEIVSALPREFELDLDRDARLELFSEATPIAIQHVLNRALEGTRAHGVAVYDVGQGSASAIVDDVEHPMVFFDFGWAPNFHAQGRPSTQPDFAAVHESSPVVLSHWDMDHWSYAVASSRFNPANLTTRHEWRPEALKRFWIARAPRVREHRLGFLTQDFVRALARSHSNIGLPALLLWPERSRRIRFDMGWIEACEPHSVDGESDRNNTGLAMFVKLPRVVGAILLPGDADFPSIPSLRGTKKVGLAGLVAPHHGARITQTAVPSPLSTGPAKLVISVGQGNSYGHPKHQALAAYRSAGWSVYSTENRSSCKHHRLSHYHGNQLLKLDNGASDPCCGCNRAPNGHLCLLDSSVASGNVLPGAKRGVRAASGVGVAT